MNHHKLGVVNLKSKKSKSKLDFLPNRNNRYSIRRFTVGTASILIGATLLFGASHDAQAAEEDSSSVSVDGQDEAGVSKDDQTAKASEEQATPAQTEDVKTSTEAEASTDTETQAQTDKEEAASTQEDAVSEDSQTTAQDSEQAEATTPAKEEAAKSEATQATEHASVKEAKSEDKKVDTESAATSEAPQATEEEVATKEESKAVQPATVADKKAVSVDPSPYANIGNVHDKATAEEFYAKATGVSAKEAKRVVNNLGLDAKNITPESFRAALLKAFSNAQNRTAVQGLSFRATPEDSEAINDMANAVNASAPTADSDNMKVIDADAYKNGYVKNDVDTTNAAHTLSGRAYMSDFGAPGTTSTRLTTVPEGTAVYMQWIDKDGWVSPAFRAYTTNQITDRDSSAAGPGFYAFDLRKPQIDANGKSHVYNATDGQYYRLWIEDFQTPNGNTATMLRQVGGLIPGTFVNSVTHLNLGQFPLIGTNMQRTGVFMGVRPTNDYMTRPKNEWIHDEEGPIANPTVNLKAKNTVSGRVWLETGDGDEANSGTGPNRNPGDPVAQGYTVVMSSLTKEGAAAYKDQVQSLDHGQRAEAAKKLLEDHPEYISATVYGETDEDGYYTVRFPEGALDVNFLYGYVMDKDGVIQNAYSSYTAPEFRTPNTNALFTPQAIPAHNLVVDPMWYHVHFAVIPRTDVEISIVDFNNTDKPAAPGDVAHIDLEGKILSPLPTHVEWRDSKGKVVKKTPDFTSLKEGEDAGTFEIPSTAKDGDHYTAVLVVNGRDVSADSLTVKVTDAHTYDPEVTPITKDYGTPTTEDDIKGAVTVPNYPTDKGTPKVTVDEGAQLPDGNTPGKTDVPVTVTYPDGSKDHVTVPVTVKEQPQADHYPPEATPVEKPFGSATTKDDVTSHVTVPGFPADKGTPKVTVDEGAQLPDGNTSGTVDVPVTVTYPDGTTAHVNVPVTTGEQPQADHYPPKATPVEKPFGSATTKDDVTSHVTVPGFPADKGTPKVTVDEGAQLPDGNTSGTVDVPVTVTYPDGTTAHVNVPVTTGEQPQADHYPPKATPVEKPFGSATTKDDVTSHVTVPGFPADKGTPTVTVDEGAQLPDGNTEGTVNVPVTVTYPDGTTAHVNVPVTTKAAEDNTKTPQVNEVTAGDDTVSGHDGQPGNTIEVTLPGGSKVPGTVDDKGEWTVKVPDNVTLKPGDKVTVVEKDNHGHTSPATEVTVKDTENTAHQPQVDPIHGGGTSVGGKGTPGNDVEVTLPGGTKVPGTVDENGNFTVKVPDGTELKPGDKVTVVEKDHNGHTSPATEVTVGDYPNTAHQPTVDPVTAGDKTVHGKGTPGNTVEVTFPGGSTVTGEVDKDGNFTVKVPDGTTLKPGQEITVVEKDNHGHASTPTKVTVGDTANEAHQPQVDPIHGGDTSVSGKGTPGHTVEVTLPDGSTVTGEVDKDGNFTIKVPDGKELKPGDKVTVVEKDKDGHSSTPTEVTVGDYPNTAHQPTVDPVTAGDKTVHGKGTPGNTVEVTLPDGSVVTGTVDKDGNFTVKVPDGTTLKPGQEITVVEKDKHGHASKPTKVTVGDTANEAHQPQVDPIHGGDTSVSGKGTPGNTVEITLPDGSKVTGTVDKDGNFTVKLPDGTTLKPGDKVTVVEKDKDGHSSTPTEVTVGDYPNTAHQPQVDPIHGGDSTIGGKGTPGNTVEVTLPDGSKVTGTVDKDGNFTIKVPDGTTLKPGDTVTVVEKDKYGHASTPTKVTVQDHANTAHQPTVNPVHTGDKTVTGKGTPGNTIELTTPCGKTLTTKVDKDGNWSIDLPEDVHLKAGDKVTVVEKDQYGHTSTPTVVTVTDKEMNGNNCDMPKKDDNGQAPMDNHGSDMNTGDMTEHASTPAMTQGHDDSMKHAEAKDDAKSEAKALPETGNTDNSGTIFGSLFAALGALFLAGRRRKKEDK